MRRAETAERELFGSADEYAGLIGAAARGTLLLDEVGDLSSSVQATLLRFIEDHIVRPQGSVVGQEVDVRMDLPLIAGHLLARCSVRTDRPLALTALALAVLEGHDWPGNVRELRQVIEEAALVAPGGVIDAEHLRIPRSPVQSLRPEDLGLAARSLLKQHPGEVYRRWLDRVETPLFQAALETTQGNQVRAAQLLGIHRTTLRKRARDLGLLAGDEGEDDAAITA